MDIVLSFAVLVVAIVWIVLLRRYLRTARASTQVEWRRRWNALDPQRRQAIIATMRRGEAVDDPEAAEFAGLLVGNLKRLRRAVRPMLIVLLLLFAGLIAIGLVEDSGVQVVTALLAFALMGVMTVFQRARLRKLEQSAAASERLHAFRRTS
jgi:hypothetical protein